MRMAKQLPTTFQLIFELGWEFDKRLLLCTVMTDMNWRKVKLAFVLLS
jgi:hypothetical protein